MLPIFFATYGTVFIAEIVGDKLLYTTGVLATRYRTAPILFGMAVAFMAKMGAAVLVGKAISTLPPLLVAAITTLNFFGIAYVLWRKPDQREVKESAPAKAPSAFRASAGRRQSFAYGGLIVFTILLYFRPNEWLPIGTFPLVKIVALSSLAGLFIVQISEGRQYTVARLDVLGAQARSRDQVAAREAAAWTAGLAEWDQTGDRISRLHAAADIRLYTPGSRAATPLALLGSLRPPDGADEEDVATWSSSSASSLLALAGIEETGPQTREHTLVATILSGAGAHADLPWLVQQIQRPSFERVGVLDLETFFGAKDRQALALRFNNVLASPGFNIWLSGDPLDIGALRKTFAALVQSCRVWRNGEPALDGDRVGPDDEVAILPPVSGG